MICVRNVYMVQASNVCSVGSFKSAYLPYAVGLLVAYAFSDEEIRKAYEFKRFVFIRENTDEVIEKMENPAYVGFSSYVWNTEYNLVLAKKIKEKYPDCIIQFGGHHVPPDNSFLEKYPFIDFLIHAEGEESFKALLLELKKDKPDFSKVPNLSYRVSENEYAKTEVKVLTRTDYPSPYLEGYFEYIYDENPDMQLDAILETSRGCPRSCAYCDWGCNSERIKVYDLDRIKKEIDWFAEHKVKFIMGADSNFGAYERDMEIVDYFIKVHEETGYPEKIRIHYAMKNPDRVFEITKKFDRCGISKDGSTISFQSLNPKTLEYIGRKNMTLDKFRELNALYKKEGVITYSELLIGLPGETYESHCRGFGMLIAAGQHREVRVYNVELLPNSPMAKAEYMKRHGIKTAEVNYHTSNLDFEDDIREKSNYVVETNTMTREDWIRINIFSRFVESYHYLGILKYISIYLFYEMKVDYDKFYNDIIDLGKENKSKIVSSIYNYFYGYYSALLKNEEAKLYENSLYGETTWVPTRVAHLDTIYRLDDFYSEIKNLVMSYGVSEFDTEELFKYQKTVLKLPNRNNFSETFTKNYHEYFTEILAENYIPLVEKQNTVYVNNKSHPDNWKDYAVEAAWLWKNGGAINPDIAVKYE